ncbi:MAG: periplasmic heavy metal sensor [Kiritimatiellia bacterium]|nr:periplasmic heavy metal sensor [Kiritimatiellia bacterium]
MKKKTVVVVAVVLMTGSVFLNAQEPLQGEPPSAPPPPQGQGGDMMRGRQGPNKPSDPLEENFFAPELLMRYQKAIGLSDEQKTYIKDEIQKTQAKFNDLQWKLQPEMETLASMLADDSVDEKQILAQLDEVMKLESDIKKTHIVMAIRIKSKLTKEQQAKLKELKPSKQMGPIGMGRGPGTGPGPVRENRRPQ